MKSKILISALLITAIAIFTSCEKEDANSDESQTCSNMLYFDSEEELVAEMNCVSKMTLDEKVQWEKSKGFNSIEIAAEKLYKSIKPDDFKTKEEVVSFVKKNSDYLQLVEDENGEFELETCLDGNILKYFANSDGFFQVGDSIYKVYNEGTIATSSNNFEDLKNYNFSEALQNSQFRCISNRTHSSEKSSTVGCLLDDPIREDSGNERIKLYFYPSNLHTGYFIMNISINSYKRVLGIWWNVDRTLTCDLTIDCAYKGLDGIWATHVFNYQNTGYKGNELSGELFSGKKCLGWQVSPNEVLGIYAYSVIAAQTNVSTALLTCSSY